MEIINARQTRGTTYSRYFNMGYHLQDRDLMIAELVLDMVLRGVTSRPTIQQVAGKLETEYERRYDVDWQTDMRDSQVGMPEDSWDED
jgi:hypothetical protein